MRAGLLLRALVLLCAVLCTALPAQWTCDQLCRQRTDFVKYSGSNYTCMKLEHADCSWCVSNLNFRRFF
jgi:hypothetical protein